MACPAELLERETELGQRAAIEIARHDELVARLQQDKKIRNCAAWPEAAATAARPPSRLAMRSSSTDTVGLVRRE